MRETKKEITAYLYFIKSRPRAKNKHQNLDLLNFLFDVRHSERYQQPLVCSALIKCRERNTLQRQRRTKISNIGAFVALNSLFPELEGEVLAQRGLPMKPPQNNRFDRLGPRVIVCLHRWLCCVDRCGLLLMLMALSISAAVAD